MIIIRRFWCCNGRGSKAIHVDVRTREGVGAAEARLKAEAFAAKKLKNQNVWSMRVSKRGPAQFTIGPRK